jgi:hypothetical protein
VRLCRLQPGGDDPSSHPAILLEHLLGVAQSEDMRAKIKLMLKGLVQVGRHPGWTAGVAWAAAGRAAWHAAVASVLQMS